MFPHECQFSPNTMSTCNGNQLHCLLYTSHMWFSWWQRWITNRVINQFVCLAKGQTNEVVELTKKRNKTKNKKKNALRTWMWTIKLYWIVSIAMQKHTDNLQLAGFLLISSVSCALCIDPIYLIVVQVHRKFFLYVLVVRIRKRRSRTFECIWWATRICYEWYGKTLNDRIIPYDLCKMKMFQNIFPFIFSRYAMRHIGCFSISIESNCFALRIVIQMPRMRKHG